MAEDDTLDSILRHGLRSTTALLDLYGVHGNDRTPIESRRRPKLVEIENDDYGRATIRDNRPFQEKRMDGRMIGMTFPEWYEHLNNRVFFWVSRSRLERFLGAYSERPHLVLVVDTQSLVESHVEHMTLSGMNSGATNFTPPKRGVGTFLPLSEHPFDERRAANKDPVVEVTVEYGVPDISPHLVRVERHINDTVEEVEWSAP